PGFRQRGDDNWDHAHYRRHASAHELRWLVGDHHPVGRRPVAIHLCPGACLSGAEGSRSALLEIKCPPSTPHQISSPYRLRAPSCSTPPTGRSTPAPASIAAPPRRRQPDAFRRTPRPRARPSGACPAAARLPGAQLPGARPLSIPKDWIKLKKQVLVSVDRAETRVALLEASGTPAASPAPVATDRRSASKAVD